jgi:hypothetical protein
MLLRLKIISVPSKPSITPLFVRIESQLIHDPDHATRNRKPLKPPSVFGATWELRFGPRNRFRVLYDIDTQNHIVHILAVGVKERNRLFVGGEETKP